MRLGRLLRRSARVMLVLMTLMITPLLRADTLFFSFDEFGKGFLCNGTGGSVAIPLCAVDRISGNASFARVPSGFTDDPTPGGLTHVLTYALPFDVGNFDMYLRAPDEAVPGDLIRGLGTTILFYSLQELTGTGNCSIASTPPATGCDGLADVPMLPVGRQGISTTLELGPEGDNHGLFFEPSVGNLITFIPHSDELIACPANLHCGPMNIAPPANNPFRDITGLPGQDALVVLPADDPTDPIATNTPEPDLLPFVILGLALIVFGSQRMSGEDPRTSR